MTKNHVKKTITHCLSDFYFQLSNNRFNSVLDLNTTTVSGDLKSQKARLKFSLTGITAFTLITAMVLHIYQSSYSYYRNNKFAK
jgi:hypothetical protein